MGKKIEFEYPENLGCTYRDGKGELCAHLQCWAQVLLECSRDLDDSTESRKRRQAIIDEAKAAGCKAVLNLEEYHGDQND